MQFVRGLMSEYPVRLGLATHLFAVKYIAHGQARTILEVKKWLGACIYGSLVSMESEVCSEDTRTEEAGFY